MRGVPERGAKVDGTAVETGGPPGLRRRPVIAFFDYPDVFEDFYPHYGVDQRTFATRWAATGSHAFLSVLQREIGDVVWYACSLRPALSEARHEIVGCRVRLLRSSCLHRSLWHAFYRPRHAWRWRDTGYRSYATLASYLALLSLPVIRALRRDRPDCIFAQGYSSGRFDVLWALARVLGVPLIAYHAGGTPAGYLGRAVRRWTIPRADRLIVSGRDEYEMLITRYHVSATRLSVVLTPIDTEALRPIERAKACEAAGLDPARRYVLFVGRLDDEVKRVSALLVAFGSLMGQHPDVDLLVVGDGPDGPALRQAAAQCAPGRVRLLGWVSGSEALGPLYNAAECLVLPSRREGFPTVVGEAMACGTPVLASSVGAVAELVKSSQTGWLVAPGDDQALSSRLAWFLANREAVAAMRPRAREAALRRVSPEAVAEQLRECFSFGARRS